MEKKISKRQIIQLIVFALAVLVTINHSLIESGNGISWLSSGYIHYVCPICGVTTIYQYFASSVDWLTKIQNPVSIVLGLSMIMAILFGPLFCGWICPFGAFQDFMALIGEKINKKKYNKFINPKVDGVLRWFRYVTLLVVLYMTAKSAVAVLESINPYHALLNLFVGEFAVIGLVMLLVVVVASLFIQRPWCKYLCPYGAFLGIFNIYRVKAIVREESTCINCKMCDRTCPMNIQVSKVNVVRDHQCISCMECTSKNTCPKVATVKMTGTKGIQEKVKLNVVNISAFVVAIAALVIITANISLSATETEGLTIDSSNVTAKLSGEYNSGTYTGEGTGFNTGLTVEITIEDNQITDLEITKHNETIGYYEPAFEVVPNSIVTSQSTDVDTVSGATRSSEGIIEAVNNALSKAEVLDGEQAETVEAEESVEAEIVEVKEPVEEESSDSVANEEVTSKNNYINGLYEGSSTGYSGEVKVEVTVANSAIKSIDVIENNETSIFFQKALAVIDDMISSQSTDVDGVSGATLSSNAIIGATKDALSDAIDN
jgi:uncharacterized protein with FMN-binding domain/NAD-dependent dihydropyrimidine dehydrogenase PreA subunit